MDNQSKAEAGNRIYQAAERDRAEIEQNVINKIDKLFKLAAKAGTEAEATAALNKAQELMEQYNLSEAAITEGASSAKAAKRTDEKHKGGLYQFQRDLWEAIANLNFCFYWNLYERDHGKVSKYWVRKYGGIANVPEWRKGGYVFRHRLVGRAVNVQATLSMAGYIEGAIERLVKERIGERVTHLAKVFEDRYGHPAEKIEEPLWGEWAVKFREGIADTVIQKINERRREVIREAKKQEIKVPDEAKREGVQTGTALSLMTVIEQEHAANYDFMNGEGAYADLLAKRARWAAEDAAEQARYAEWAAANPEEAKKEEEKRRKSARRTSWNAGMGKDKTDHGAYWDGRDAGKSVSIDPQVKNKTAGLLK